MAKTLYFVLLFIFITVTFTLNLQIYVIFTDLRDQNKFSNKKGTRRRWRCPWQSIFYSFLICLRQSKSFVENQIRWRVRTLRTLNLLSKLNIPVLLQDMISLIYKTFDELVNVRFNVAARKLLVAIYFFIFPLTIGLTIYSWNSGIKNISMIIHFIEWPESYSISNWLSMS